MPINNLVQLIPISSETSKYSSVKQQDGKGYRRKGVDYIIPKTKGLKGRQVHDEASIWCDYPPMGWRCLLGEYCIRSSWCCRQVLRATYRRDDVCLPKLGCAAACFDSSSLSKTRHGVQKPLAKWYSLCLERCSSGFKS
jgi:hypothetical protein